MSHGEILSLVLSAASAAATFYFWLVRANAERPRLAATPIQVAHVEIKPGPTDATRWLGLKLLLAVTNLSLRPDVLTGAAVRVRDRTGHWIGVSAAPGIHIGSNTPLPIKLASHQSAAVVVWVWVEVPPQGVSVRFLPEYLEYVRKALPTPLRLRVDLRGLGGEAFAGDPDLSV